MTETLTERLTQEEMTVELREAFAELPAVVTIEADYLISILSTALFRVQEETAARVRREMLRGSLN